MNNLPLIIFHGMNDNKFFNQFINVRSDNISDLSFAPVISVLLFKRHNTVSLPFGNQGYSENFISVVGVDVNGIFGQFFNQLNQIRFIFRKFCPKLVQTVNLGKKKVGAANKYNNTKNNFN